MRKGNVIIIDNIEKAQKIKRKEGWVLFVLSTDRKLYAVNKEGVVVSVSGGSSELTESYNWGNTYYVGSNEYSESRKGSMALRFSAQEAFDAIGEEQINTFPENIVPEYFLSIDSGIHNVESIRFYRSLVISMASNYNSSRPKVVLQNPIEIFQEGSFYMQSLNITIKGLDIDCPDGLLKIAQDTGSISFSLTLIDCKINCPIFSSESRNELLRVKEINIQNSFVSGIIYPNKPLRMLNVNGESGNGIKIFGTELGVVYLSQPVNDKSFNLYMKDCKYQSLNIGKGIKAHIVNPKCYNENGVLVEANEGAEYVVQGGETNGQLFRSNEYFDTVQTSRVRSIIYSRTEKTTGAPDEYYVKKTSGGARLQLVSTIHNKVASKTDPSVESAIPTHTYLNVDKREVLEITGTAKMESIWEENSGYAT